MSTPTPGTSRPAWRDQFGWYALGIFVVAFVVRALHVWQLRSAPFFSLPMGDAESYHTWGKEIAAGDWIGTETFYQAPLYPYFLGTIYTLFGPDLLTLRLVQAALGSASCALLAVVGHRFFSRNVGIVAGLMLALYAPALFFDGLIQKSVLDVFLVCLSLALLSALVRQPHQRWAWLWPGVAVGCLMLTRENAAVFVVAILVWLVAFQRQLGRERLMLGATFALGLAMVLVPVATRNKVVGGEFQLTTMQFGPNFYIGNNPDADGTYQPLVFGRGDPRYERRDATEIAERALGRTLTAGQVSRYWTGRALEYIWTQPGDWLRLTARKVMLAWNASEVADTEDQLSHADWSIPLRLSGYVWHFGVLAPLAFAGIGLTWHRRAQLSLLYLMLVAYAASLVMFAVMGRYRYPLVPFLVLFSAAGVVAIPRALGTGWSRQTIWGGVATVAVLVFCNWPVLSMGEMRAVTALNLGTELQAQGKLDEAISQYRHALELTPDDALAHSNLGTALAAQGKFDEAIGHYERALTLAPEDADSYSNLGNTLVALDRTDEAIRRFRQALDIDPSSAEAHGGLGAALQSQGKVDEAITHLRRAIELGPALVDAHNYLGLALASQNRMADAIVEFRRALEIDPDFADAHANLARAAQLDGNLDQAIHHYRELLRIAPESSETHNDLGVALASQNELAEAIDHFRQAIQSAPQFAEAHGNLAMALQIQGNLDEAIRHYQEAARIAPGNPELESRLQAALALCR